jgi:streptomycin 6-kinase
MNLPRDFINNVTLAFGDPGRRYLNDLPDLLCGAAHRWELTILEPFLLSFNYVCAVTRADGTPAVLKIGIPNPELNSEINTLHYYGGQGACKLLDSDPEKGSLLLERLQPGTMLVTIDDDDKATEIAAEVLKAIHRSVPEKNGFLSLQKWFDELKLLRPHFGGRTGPFQEKTVDIVERLIIELFAEEQPQALLHGDFHHFNILLSEHGWMVIDPKGVVGPAEYEVGPLLMNPWNEMPDKKAAIQRTQRRISILSEIVGFDRQKVWAWAVCHSLLSAWWDTAEDGSGGDYSRAWMEIFLKTKI